MLECIYDTFPDVERDNPAQAYRRALVDWYHSRQSNSKSAKLAGIKNDTEAIISILTQANPEEIIKSIAAARAAGCDCVDNYDDDGIEK